MKIECISVRCKCGNLILQFFEGEKEAVCYTCGEHKSWEKLLKEWEKKKKD